MEFVSVPNLGQMDSWRVTSAFVALTGLERFQSSTTVRADKNACPRCVFRLTDLFDRSSSSGRRTMNQPSGWIKLFDLMISGERTSSFK